MDLLIPIPCLPCILDLVLTFSLLPASKCHPHFSLMYCNLEEKVQQFLISGFRKIILIDVFTFTIKPTLTVLTTLIILTFCYGRVF